MLLPNDTIDWLVYLFRMKWLIAVCLLCFLGSFFMKRVGVKNNLRYLRVVLVAIAVLALLLCVYGIRGRDMWIALLGSEDDNLAEQAYWQIQNSVSDEWLVEEINANQMDVNTKFYLARMLGSNLRQENLSAQILSSLDSEPLKPIFFRANTLNREIKHIPEPLTPQSIAGYYSQKSRPSHGEI